MNQQSMGVGGDVRHPAMVALEVQGTGCDHALDPLQRRARPAAAIGAGRGSSEPLHVILVVRTAAVGAHGSTRGPHPWRQFLCRCCSQQAKGTRAEQAGATGEKDAAVQQSSTGNEFGILRDLVGDLRQRGLLLGTR